MKKFLYAVATLAIFAAQVAQGAALPVTPIATETRPGLVKAGGDITVAPDGTVTVNGGGGGGGGHAIQDEGAPLTQRSTLNFVGEGVTAADIGGKTVITIPAGPAGAAATVAVGTTTTGSAGTSATVTNSGTSSAAVFNFTIPRGATGATGATGAQGVQGPQGPQGVAGGSTNWRGAWDIGTAYSSNDAISHNGASYIALGSTTGNEPPNATYWNLLAAKGDTGATGGTGAQGEQGVQGEQGIQGIQGPEGPEGPQGPEGPAGADGGALNFLGAWSSVTAYVALDTVTYNGSSYAAIASSTNVAPGTDPLKWQLMAQKGADGAQGPQGVQGNTGPAGTTDYNELENLPPLGTAAATDADAYATAAQGAKADNYFVASPSYSLTPWAGYDGYTLDPQAVRVYGGSNAAPLSSVAPLLRGMAVVAATTTPGTRGGAFYLQTDLRDGHDKKWSGLTHVMIDRAVGKGDHTGISSYVHASTDRNLTGGAVSTGGDGWAFHGFVANNGKHANSIGMELNNVNTDTVDYLDDQPDGAGPNTSGYMQTGVQLVPDGSTKHSTRAINIGPHGSIGYDTGITLRGHRSTGIYINSPISATRTDIKWGSGTSTYGLDLSAHTFSGAAVKLGSAQAFTDGTITKTLADLAGPALSGNTTTAATVSGTLTAGKQLAFDADGNVIASAYDVGATGGGGSGTVSSGTAGQLARYDSDGTTVTGYTLPITVAGGKTLTVNNTLTLAGTDSASVNFGAGGTVSYISPALASLTNDVLLTSPATGQILYYNGTKWVNSGTIASGNLQLTAGSLGIGVAPSARVHVSQAGGATPTEVFRLETTGNAGATRGPRFLLKGQNAGSSQDVAAIDGLSPSAGNGNLVFSTVDSSTLTEHLRVSSTGVAVTGALSATGTMTANAIAVTSTTEVANLKSADSGKLNGQAASYYATAASVPTLASGTYTPTATAGLNVSSTSGGASFYTRVGSTVTGHGVVTVDPVAIGVTQITVTPPVASAFSAQSQATGVVGTDAFLETGEVYADTTSGTDLLISFTAASAASHQIAYSFSYSIQ